MKDGTKTRTTPRLPLDHAPAELRRRRFLAGISQRELAERIGCSPAYISELESGSRNPSPALLKRVAGGLGCDVAALLADDEVA